QTAFAGSHKSSPELDLLPRNQSVDVIVQYSHVPDVKNISHAKNAGTSWKRTLHLVNAASYRVTPAALDKLLAVDSAIKYVTPDRPVRATLDYANAAVNATIAHDLGYDGTGIGVAVVDS